jgi:hypothetical protein
VIVALAQPLLARLFRTPRGWIVPGAWCAFALALALATRSRGTAHGADHVLLGAYGTLVLPLLAYAIVGAALGAGSVSRSTAPVVALGASPKLAAMATVAVAVLACALIAAVLTAATALVAHGSADPPRARDAVASAYAGMLGGAAYASWFIFGASLGRRGGGRTALLVIDWVLGAGSGAAALVTPRGHVRSLLGGTPPMDLSERASACGLVLIALAAAVLTIRRARS